MDQDDISDANFEEIVTDLEASPVSNPNWLRGMSLSVSQYYRRFRADIEQHHHQWSITQYSERRGLFYFELARLYYNLYSSCNINLATVKYILQKSLSELERVSRNGTNYTEILHDVQQCLKKVESEEKLLLKEHNESIIYKNSRHVLVFWKISNQPSNEQKWLNCSNLKGVKMINLIFILEEILMQEFESLEKYKFSCYLSKAYACTENSNIAKDYVQCAARQLQLTISTDTSDSKKQQVRRIIKEKLNQRRTMQQVKNDISIKYETVLNNFELNYIEKKYVKYCFQLFVKNCENLLTKHSVGSIQEKCEELLFSLGKMYCLENVPDLFKEDYYKLLLTNRHYILDVQEIEYLNNLKQICLSTIKSYVEGTRKELIFLKQLVAYLCSVEHCRELLHELQLREFCEGHLTIAQFIQIVLKLSKPYNDYLVILKSTAMLLENSTSLSSMKHFLETFNAYITPVKPELRQIDGRKVIYVAGKLIILSEVLPEILRIKTKFVEEVHFVDADIFHVDENLIASNWFGVNILVMAKFIRIHGSIIWDVSGRDGIQHEVKAADGDAPGSHGKDGRDGCCGESGGNVHISSSKIINSYNFTIKSLGGNGSGGQSGGRGQNGNNGVALPKCEFKKLFPKLTHGLFETKTSMGKTATKILERVHDNVEINWTQSSWYSHIASMCRAEHRYIEGKTPDGCHITFSYYNSPIWSGDEAYLLYCGSLGQAGGRGGKGGIAGKGGFGGEIVIPSNYTNDIKISNRSGNPGVDGEDGVTGMPGKNGWDIGYIFRDGWFSDTYKIIGEFEDCKLTLQYHKFREKDDYVFCKYKESIEESYYAEIRPKTNIYNLKTPNECYTKKQTHRPNTEPVHKKTISSELILTYERQLFSDSLGDASYMLRQPLTSETILEKEEQTDEKEDRLKVTRQAHYEYANTYLVRKFIRTLESVLFEHEASIESIVTIFSNPKVYESWLCLQNDEVYLNDLQTVYMVLLNNKDRLNRSFIKIYSIYIKKYKFAIFEYISQKICWPDQYEIFSPENMQEYLVKGESDFNIANHELGNLMHFFTNDNYRKRELLRNHAENMSLVFLLYPLKFFIAENSHINNLDKIDVENITKYLDNLEMKLLRLIQSYMTIYQQNKESSLLQEILNFKENIKNRYNDKKRFKSILSLFFNYLLERGVTTAAYRELVACSFNINIKIYALDSDNKPYILHSYNPSATDAFYLLFDSEHYTEMRIDHSYLNLVGERKHKSAVYSKILSYISTCFHTRQYHAFLKHFEVPENFTSISISCVSCRKCSEIKLINEITRYFPNSERVLVRTKLQKLSSHYIGNRDILCTLFHRFEVEGRHISVDELFCLINTVLKYQVKDNNDLGIFLWIISAYSQKIWLKELFLLELENYFKISLAKDESINNALAQIKQRNIVLLMFIKLYDKNDVITLESLKKCLQIFCQINVNSSYVENLPLSKWQYVLKKLLLNFRLSKLNNLHGNDLQRACYYVNCIENIALVDKFLKIIEIKQNDLSSSLLLKILSNFHNQEGSFNENIVESLSQSTGEYLRIKLESLINNIDRSRTLKDLSDIIRSDPHTSKQVKVVLNKFWSRLVQTKYEKGDTEQDMQNWVENFKTTYNNFTHERQKKMYITENVAQIINMVTGAIYLKRGFWLRKTQRLALLLLLTHDHSGLAQIATGEGKSLIVVGAAIVKALCNEKVDVITSSSVLAERDATINADIYKFFGVSVSHNCSDDIRERKDAYSKCQVVYGDLSNFQRDYLLNTFYGKNILGDRSLQNVIVDEVDSMFLDKGNNTLYLSHNILGMDKLESVYLFIWKLIASPYNNTAKCPTVDDVRGAVFRDLFGSITQSDLMRYLDATTQQANVIYQWLIDRKVLEAEGKCLCYLDEKLLQKLRNNLKHFGAKLSFVIEKILDRNKEINIPKCFHLFLKRNIDIWIKNAILAFVMEEGQDYVVDVDRTMNRADINPNIIIIDKGTGTDQSNSQWERALHQFLQLKHGCRISPQNLKAVFVSNVSYFNKYDNLFGLSGTLGSLAERDLLMELYDVHFVNIPTAKPKKFEEHEPISCTTQTEWMQEIVSCSQDMTHSRRSVLVVCETIKDVDILNRAFQQANITDCLVYKRAHEECKIAQGKQKLGPGRVLIATNLAGRGTDIKINQELDSYGGLHVIISYFPENVRIEQQAFGRAARCGRSGSGQLIIINSDTVPNLRKQKYANELCRLADLKLYYDTIIKNEEELFRMFTKTYQKIEKSIVCKGMSKIILQRSLDRWAFWLDECSETSLNDRSRNSCSIFLEELESNSLEWSKWQEDPIQLTLLGLYYYGERQFDQAVDIFDLVIRNEPQFCEAAHYYKAAALCGLIDFEEKPLKSEDVERRTELVEELLSAERLFEEHSDACSIAAAFVEHMKQLRKNSFIQVEAYREQQQARNTIYSVYIDSVRNILGYPVSSCDFRDSEIDWDITDQIYKDMFEKEVLIKPFVQNVSLEDVKDIALNYGLAAEDLKLCINNLSGYFLENDFLKEIRKRLVLPSAEEFWKILLSKHILKNEVKFIVIDKSKLNADEIGLLKNILEMNVNFEENDNKHVFLRYCRNFNKDVNVLYEKKFFVNQVGKIQYEKFKQCDAVKCNKMAEYVNQNFTGYFTSYDSIDPKHLNLDGIKDVEATNILNILCDKKIIEKDGLGIYRLLVRYDNIEFPNIYPYQESISRILKINFSYRIALQRLQTELNNSPTSVFLRLSTRPHLDLMWDLVNKKIIIPSKVNIDKKNFDEIVTNVIYENIEKLRIRQISQNLNFNDLAIVRQTYSRFRDPSKIMEFTKRMMDLLKIRASPLDSLAVPDYNFVPVKEYIRNMEISPLELNTFASNALSYILKLEEKKWTFQMKRDAIILLGMGFLQILVGTIITFSRVESLAKAGYDVTSKGVSDVICSISAWKTGYFSWIQYREQKLSSLAISVITGGITSLMAAGALTSLFGSKIAQEELMAINGKEIAKITGLELIENAGFKTVSCEVMKQVVKDTCEGIANGLIYVGVEYVVENHLQKLCKYMCGKIMRRIDDVLKEHTCVTFTLQKIYCTLGPEQARNYVTSLTKKHFAPTVVSGSILLALEKVFVPLNDYFSLLCRPKQTQVININMEDVLSLCKFMPSLAEIRTITSNLLHEMELEMEKELECRENVKSDGYPSCYIKQFQESMIELWEEELSSNAQRTISENIMKPILYSISSCTLKYVQKKGKRFYDDIKDKYNKHQFDKKKQDFKRQLQEKGDSKSEEAKSLLEKEYQDSLMKLGARTRSPHIYADSVLENGPVDSVCLTACTKAIPKLFQEKNMQCESVKIIVTSETNLKQEFRTSTEEATRVIHLTVKDNHFTNLNENSYISSAGYDGLYSSLLRDWPELSNISPDEFRKSISDTVRTDADITNIIRKGHHEFTLGKKLYGGHVNTQLSAETIHDELVSNKSGLSQCSVGEYTLDKIYLSELANSIKSNGYNGEPINGVAKENSSLIFLDNRRTAASSSLNDTGVNITVRIFNSDKKLPEDKQYQYKSKTAGEAAETRIKSNSSFKDNSVVKTGYKPSDVRIRIKDEQNIKTCDDFFLNVTNIGCTIRARSNSFH